jgi:RNA polymerase sigma-70 factor, ECF subfamily
MSDFTARMEVEIPRLRRYARALARDAERADDLVQSCLLRALANEHSWQPGSDLRAWLFTILHNLHVSEIRRSVREQDNSAVVTSVTVAVARQSDPAAVLDLVDIERAIAKLPDWQRQVLLLIGFEEMSYGAAATILGLRVGTVRSRLGRARASLRRLINSEAQTPAPSAVGSRSSPLRPSRSPVDYAEQLPGI